jgi:hypothetical protein
MKIYHISRTKIFRLAQDMQEDILPTPAQIKSVVNELITGVQRTGLLSSDQKYDFFQNSILIDNDPYLNDLVMQFGEDGYEILQDALRKELQMREENVFRQRAKKNDDGDELGHLRSAVRGKNWNDAKTGIAYMMPGGSMEFTEGHVVSDEDAEDMFQRLYSTIHGGHLVDYEAMKRTSPYVDENGEHFIRRLSDIRNPRGAARMDSREDPRGYTDHVFIDQVFGYKFDRAPESIEIYRGVPTSGGEIRPGDWVTTDRGYARSYIRGKQGSILRKTVPSEDLVIMKLDLGTPEFIYHPKSMESMDATPEVEAPLSLKEFWMQEN